MKKTIEEINIGNVYIAAKNFRASEIVSPYPYAVKSIKENYEKYQQVKEVFSGNGLEEKQIRDLKNQP